MNVIMIVRKIKSTKIMLCWTTILHCCIINGNSCSFEKIVWYLRLFLFLFFISQIKYSAIRLIRTIL